MANLRQLRERVIDSTGLVVGPHSEAADEAINEAYLELVARLNLYQRSATVTLTVGDGDYSILTDFAITDLTGVRSVTWVATGTGTEPAPMEEVDPDVILAYRQQDAVTSTGMDSYYALLGLDTFMLYPVPAVASSLAIYYTARPTTLQADSDTPSQIPLEFHDAIEKRAIARLGRRKRDRIGEWSYWDQQADKSLDQLQAWANKRKSDSPRRITQAYPGNRLRRARHRNDQYWTGDR
jgi:hypothetical protein